MYFCQTTPPWSSNDGNHCLPDDYEHMSRADITSDEDDLASDLDETRDPLHAKIASSEELDSCRESAIPQEANSLGDCAPQHQTAQSLPWRQPAARLPTDNPTHTMPDPICTPAPGPMAPVHPYIASLASDLRLQLATDPAESSITGRHKHTPDIMKYNALMTFLFAWIYAFHTSASLAHLISPIQRVLTDPSSADQMQEALVRLQAVVLQVLDDLQSEVDFIHKELDSVPWSTVRQQQRECNVAPKEELQGRMRKPMWNTMQNQPRCRFESLKRTGSSNATCLIAFPIRRDLLATTTGASETHTNLPEPVTQLVPTSNSAAYRTDADPTR